MEVYHNSRKSKSKISLSHQLGSKVIDWRRKWNVDGIWKYITNPYKGQGSIK
jgi:hypothetical protein